MLLEIVRRLFSGDTKPLESWESITYDAESNKNRIRKGVPSDEPHRHEGGPRMKFRIARFKIFMPRQSTQQKCYIARLSYLFHESFELLLYVELLS